MSRERRDNPAQQGKVDARVAERAGRQWGVVDLEDARACGLTPAAIEWRVARGRWFPKYRGVWAVGHPNVPLEGEFLAAVKACGRDAVLSHYSAGVLWRLLRWDGRYPEVTAPTPRTHPGIHTHRSATVERTLRYGIPVTPVLRTLMDLAASKLSRRQLRRAVNEALNQRLIKPHEIITTHHRGARRLRALLADAAPTRNEFEDAVLTLLAGLPTPEVNARRGDYVPDFRWNAHGLIVEADSVQFHGHILARADDARRQRTMEAQGWRFLRVTWAQVTREPLRTRARIERGLNTQR